METIEIILETKTNEIYQDILHQLNIKGIPYAEQSLENEIEINQRSPEEDLLISVYFSARQQAFDWSLSLQEQYGDAICIVRRNYISNEIWQSAWDTSVEKVQSEKFVVYSGDSKPTEDRLIPIPINSLGAFGNGQHATTLASLKILEEIKVQKSLLDVGTGTGILAIAAQKIGYHDIVATDIDPNALESAKFNFQMNQVSIPLIEGSFPENRSPFDIVISNILVPEVLRLIPQLVSHLSDHEDARLLLSGFHSANRDLVIKACAKEGLLLGDERKEREWLALAFVRRRKK